MLQAIKIHKVKEVKDVSVWTFVMILAIGTMWLIYGIQIKSLPLIIGNAVKLIASLSVIVVYSIYKKKFNFFSTILLKYTYIFK